MSMAGNYGHNPQRYGQPASVGKKRGGGVGSTKCH